MKVRKIILVSAILCTIVGTNFLFGQENKSTFTTEIYGSVWLNTGYNFQSEDPDWKDMLRPSKLLNSEGKPYGDEGNYHISIRPSQFGVRVNQNLPNEEQLQYNLEIDFLAGGSFTGQTFFRLRKLFAKYKGLTIGQDNSLFMDGGVIPNTVEYFGPNGIILIRNIQLSVRPIQNENHELAIGIENPSATSDLGPYDREFTYGELLENVDFVNKLPAFTGHYRYTRNFGHVQAAWCLKNINWSDQSENPDIDLSGSEWGYGLNLTSRIKVIPDKFDLLGSFTLGKGVQNFTNDGASDIGVKRNLSSETEPIYGESIPFYMYMIYGEAQWNEKWRSAFGYSFFNNDTFNTQLSTSFKSGAYATANVVYSPIPKLSIGLEYQYADRKNNDFGGDPTFNLPSEKGASYNIHKIQAMFSYQFSTKKD